MEFYFQSNSVKNSLICPKTKSATHCLIELFSIYQIIPSSRQPTVLYWRLSDLWIYLLLWHKTLKIKLFFMPKYWSQLLGAHAKIWVTGGPPLVQFLIVRISNWFGFLEYKNLNIFLISMVFSTFLVLSVPN